MARQIQLSVEGASRPATIELYDEDAPETTDAVWDALPIEETIINGKFSGEEVFAELDEELRGIDPENWEFNAAPRDVGYWFSQWEEGAYERDTPPLAEMVFVYGRRIRIRKGPDRPSAINLFGRIADGFDAFAEIARRTQREGEKSIALTRIE